jgi:hypothetical protein
MKTIETPSRDHRTRIQLFAVACLLAVVMGCADPFETADDAQWYSAQVLRVLKPLELDDSVNRSCLDGLAEMPEQVAVVTVRIHRARHLAAFAVPALAKVQVKDRVTVNFRLCQLRPAPAAS